MLWARRGLCRMTYEARHADLEMRSLGVDACACSLADLILMASQLTQ
jgi:hypothetical protein